MDSCVGVAAAVVAQDSIINRRITSWNLQRILQSQWFQRQSLGMGMGM